MKLYNTLTRQSDDFEPLKANQVKLYSCGPTVYDYLHIGNWATYLRWDVLVRVLRASDYSVQWIMNITDVGHLTSDADEGEDKLEKGAQREGKSAWEVADFYTQDFMRGVKALGIDLGTGGQLVKATDHIDEQIQLVQTLADKGYTYEIAGDGIYFDTSKLDDYGKLARLDIEGLRAGARVEASRKKQPTDFALWKFSPADKKRDMEWESPWGKGFPGWHIECSAMAMKYLGETLDIHTGGIDHIPVHHTNEIAQSEAATGKPFVRWWLHSNFLLVDNQKIAKSLGNGIRLQDMVEKGFDGQDLRMLVLQSHYRSEATFTWEVMGAAHARLLRWQAAASLRWQPSEKTSGKNNFQKSADELLAALQDDLNTPEGLRIIDQAFDNVEANGLGKDDLQPFGDLLQTIHKLLGINLFDEDISDDERHFIKSREQAREQKDWEHADELRMRLEKAGLAVRDTANGSIWYRI